MIFRLLSVAFGLVMIAATGVGPRHGPAFVVVVCAVGAVLAGTVFRPATTLAVLLAVAALAFSGPPPMFAAVSGLAATFYLVLRHASANVLSVSSPTIVAALGFTVVGLAATSFPLTLPWLPLAAPPAVLAIYVLATRPFSGEGS